MLSLSEIYSINTLVIVIIAILLMYLYYHDYS